MKPLKEFENGRTSIATSACDDVGLGTVLSRPWICHDFWERCTNVTDVEGGRAQTCHQKGEPVLQQSWHLPQETDLVRQQGIPDL